MNKKLLLVLALFATTNAKAHCSTTILPAEIYFSQAEIYFPRSEAIKATSEMYVKNPKLLDHECLRLSFERKVQAGFFLTTGATFALFVACCFAEWLQEFKLKSAEKAKLIALLKRDIINIKATYQQS